jgi:6-phosphofructokinase
LHDVLYSDTETPTGNFNKTLYNGFPHSKNTENLYGELRHRGPLHLQSADLFENFSPVQKQRCLWNPVLPRVFSAQKPIHIKEVKAPELVQYDEKSLRDLYPNIFDQECLEVVQSLTDLNAGWYTTLYGVGEVVEHILFFLEAATPATCFSPLRVGIVLSGGPAPGGHNVISGLFDYIKRHNPESQLFGFMGGLDGLLRGKYRVVTEDLMKRFRNQGGFDMLWSGRGRINSNDDLSAAKEVCSDLAVQGLVIVGGDGSLSNAARLAEYFAEKLPSCNVIGVPKTIDGDLRNPWIATSFGFDTAAKTYSEVIGNLCTDVTTGQVSSFFCFFLIISFLICFFLLCSKCTILLESWDVVPHIWC